MACLLGEWKNKYVFVKYLILIYLLDFLWFVYENSK